MPNFPQIYTTTVLTNAAESAANTETVVATLSNVLTRLPGQKVILRAWVALSPGTTVTDVTLNIRKNSLTGTSVASQDYTGGFTASKNGELELDAEDFPGEGQFVYVITMKGTGEGTAATFNAVAFSGSVQ